MVQVHFTVLPLVGFAAGILAMFALQFAPGIVLLIFALFVYLLPAYLVLNMVFGYQTVQGAPPLPLPASSVSSLLLLLATHAALIATVFVSFHVGVRLLERAFHGRPE